jgi:hypothetical protein
MARPERFERPTPRFVVYSSTLILNANSANRCQNDPWRIIGLQAFCKPSSPHWSEPPLRQDAHVTLLRMPLMVFAGPLGDQTSTISIMKTEPQPSDREVLAGLVERVTYQNAENGFCVIRVKARGHRDLVTVVGHAAAISAGEWITASGDWTNDRTHGQQFKARFLKTSAPTSLDGIEKYLASGMIRGIGPVYAKKLLRAFGEKVFDVIETEPDRLREVDGIGPVRANRIARPRRRRRRPKMGSESGEPNRSSTYVL